MNVILKEVPELPEKLKGNKSKYKKVVEDFLASGIKIALCETEEERKFYYGLRIYAQRRARNIEVFMRNSKVYIERTDI